MFDADYTAPTEAEIRNSQDQSDPIHFQPITADEWYDRMAKIEDEDLERMLDDMWEREQARAAAEREGAASTYEANAAHANA
jgi:hypothetical protein